MALVVEQNEAANPLDVGFFCAVGVVLEPDSVSDLVQESFWWILHYVKIGGKILPIHLKWNSIAILNRT
jgi:hypothetical protein